ncbi:MAG: VOC family protein [Pseudomonadota bacterium]
MSEVCALGYVGCTITNPAAWEEYLVAVYGLEKRQDSPAGSHQYRLDDHHHRLCLIEGDSDHLSYVGWEMETRDELAKLCVHLANKDVQFTKADAALCEDRSVMEMIVVSGPDNVRNEIFFGPKQDNVPFNPAHGMDGFNTGELGLGHIVLIASDPEAAVKWYREMLGFKLSDYIFWDGIEATFLHCNPRHHSLAFTNPVGPTKGGDLGHIMIEAKTIDDVGRAYDTVQQKDVPIAMTLGRHTNDQTTSFYTYSPSGWWIEYGFGGRLIDDSNWEPKFYNAPKLWGHDKRPPPE